MGIEDIPEMQLRTQGLVNKLINISQIQFFNGKFVVLVGSDQSYVFAESGDAFHGNITSDFHRVNKKEYGCDENFKPHGGGHLNIDGGKVRFWGLSEEYGKYDLPVVHPIIQRWMQKHFPSYQLILE